MTENRVRSIHVALVERANTLVEYLVTQPPKRLALRAATDFAWWCVGEGATSCDALRAAGRLPALTTDHSRSGQE